jgi:hypothetical protein
MLELLEAGLRVSEYSVIEEGLYAGEGCVKAPKVDAVICLEPSCRVEAPGAVEYCYPIEDFSVEPFHELARAIAKLLELRRSGRSVYVHCQAGCGRSGTVVAAYLILSRGLSGEEAIAYYRAVRGCGPQTWEQVEFLYALSALRAKIGVEEALRVLLESRDFGDFLGRVKRILG